MSGTEKLEMHKCSIDGEVACINSGWSQVNTQRGKKELCQTNSPEEEMSMKRFVKAGAQDFATHYIVGDTLVSI